MHDILVPMARVFLVLAWTFPFVLWILHKSYLQTQWNWMLLYVVSCLGAIGLLGVSYYLLDQGIYYHAMSFDLDRNGDIDGMESLNPQAALAESRLYSDVGRRFGWISTIPFITVWSVSLLTLASIGAKAYRWLHQRSARREESPRSR